MSVLYDLASYLAGQSTNFTLAQDTFVGRVPPSPGTLVGLLLPTGGPSQWAMGSTAVTFDTPRVQVLVRSTDYATGESRAEEVRNLLDHQIVNSTTVTSTGPRYLDVTLVNGPIQLQPDENERHQWSLNFGIRTER